MNMSSNQGASKGKFKTGDKTPLKTKLGLEKPNSHFVPSFPETGGGRDQYLQFGVLYG